MTSAAGKWHKHDVHVWLRSARAVLELHTNLGKQRWFPSPTQDQHTSGTSEQPSLLLQEARNKQQAQTPPGLHAGWFLPHHTAVRRQLCAGPGVWEGVNAHSMQAEGLLPKEQP